MCVTTTPTITMTNNHSTKDLPFIFMTRPPRAPRVKKCWADPAICPATQFLGIIRQRWRCRLDGVIPDQAHLGQQVGHLHARERLEQRRYLRRDFCDVAGELISPRRHHQNPGASTCPVRGALWHAKDPNRTRL